MPGSTTLLSEAADAVLLSFKQHSSQKQDVGAVEALQEFWQMKKSRGLSFSRSAEVEYEFVPSPDHVYVAYVTLPGGSCFGNFETCTTKEQAKQNAAKLALMNSVLSEHPNNKVTAESSKKMLAEATKPFQSKLGIGHNKALKTFSEILHSHSGDSVLQFQEAMTVFQLLHWNGSLKAMRERNCTREEVIQHYSNRTIDSDLRDQMSLDWVARDERTPGIILQELKLAESELDTARNSGKELRFFKEKLEVLSLAQTQTREREIAFDP
nr:LIX1-like protein [Ciona intestinalis]|eukprot:XP_002128590.3 LIX1-like protein [Ciona intestinalis]